MSYLALYRKYRPSTFEKVMGQDHIVTTLKNQLKANRIGHAYLFCGTRGTGKTSIAKLFAKAVNCESPVDGSPCGCCAMCRSIDDHTAMNVIEIDAASNNGVDNIRDIVEEVKYSPASGRYKVYIIDEVHMLSTGAFNALLKTLEEPPSYVIFILATTEVQKIPVTILSRCQRYDFKRITVDTIAACLQNLMDQENIETEEKALRYIAKAADGSMRDAQSLLDQCIAFYLGQKLTYEKVLDVLGAVDIEVFARLLRYVIKSDVNECMQLLDSMIMQGRELTQFVSDFAFYLRNLLIAKTADNPQSILEFSAENMEMLMHEAEVISEETIIRYIHTLSELSNRIRYAAQKRLIVETELIKLCKPQMEQDILSLKDRVRQLEDIISSGDFRPGSRQNSDLDTEEQNPAEKELSSQELMELAKALPEDIEAVAASWKNVIAGQSPILRPVLAAAIPSVSPEGKLMVICANETDEGVLSKDERLAEFKQKLASITGKDVEVTVSARHDKNQKAPADITKLINMEIRYTD